MSSPSRCPTCRSTSGIARVSWSGLTNTGPESEAIDVPTPGAGTSSSNRSNAVGSGRIRSASRDVSSANDPKLATNGIFENRSATPDAAGSVKNGFVPATNSARAPTDASASTSASGLGSSSSDGSSSAGYGVNGGTKSK